MPPFVKSGLMHKLANKLEENFDELVTLECMDVGMTKETASNALSFSTNLLRYYAGLANTIEGKAFA